MSDRQIEPMDDFETAMASALRTLSAPALRTIDPVTVAHEVALAHRRGTNGWRLTGARWGWLAVAMSLVVLGMLAAIVAALVALDTPPQRPSPHLGHLAYTLGTDIYVADPDGRNAVRVATGLADPGGGFEIPRWYGTTLTVSGPDASDPSAAALFAITGRGQPAHEIGPDAFSWREDGARSVDGRRFAFIAGAELSIVDLDGTATVLRPPPGHPIWDNSDLATMSWSPDGATILVGGCTVDPCQKSPLVTHDLFLVRLDGSGAEPLSTPDAPAWHAKFSPDGTEIAYMACHGGTSPSSSDTTHCSTYGYYLGVMRRDGSDRRVLVDTGGLGGWPGFQYVWSPDGRQIAYVAGRAIGEGWVADVSGHLPPRQLTIDPVSRVEWSPDGQLILAVRSDPSGNGSLWAAPVDGSTPTELVGGATDGSWEWVTDGADPFSSPRP